MSIKEIKDWFANIVGVAPEEDSLPLNPELMTLQEWNVVQNRLLKYCDRCGIKWDMTNEYILIKKPTMLTYNEKKR